ncbi:MAG TPA: non-canonical purine NTP pyrophosphatase [Ktedonobacteraceae bacterium]|nr:non-canonical purine NTP pyrophosphatase [Ktedonobacteraceae bacterium]
MNELIIGTGNTAKKNAMRAALAPLGIAVKGTDDLGISLHIPEDGATAQENARKKALAYAEALDRPVLSIDNALYLQGLSDDEQPGIHTRRVPGKTGRATDEELLAYYSAKVKTLGGTIKGRWEYALCIATPDGQVMEQVFLSPRLFVNEPCASMLPGYPLESIQIEPESGKYIAEMTNEEQDAFWQRQIGGQIAQFVQEASRTYRL